MDHTRIYVGWDSRDQRALDVCLFSIQRHASDLVEIVPLKPKAVAALCGPAPDPDGAKQARARFLVPALNGFSGWAAFVSSDMLFQADIYELWSLRDDRYAVMGVAAENRGGGQAAQRSSLLLWNCGHPANGALTPQTVAATRVDQLGRYEWLDRDQIGAFPGAWCWREGVSDPDLTPKAIEFAPAKPWSDEAEICRYADRWLDEAERIFGAPALGLMGQSASA
jgi:hypothetical protein